MYLVFDIGGTKMRLALSRDLTTFVSSPYIIDTPTLYADAIQAIQTFLVKEEEHISGDAILAVAGGIAGTLAPDKLSLIETTNIGMDWVGKPLANDIASIVGIDVANVYLENDCAIVGLGELYIGAGSGYAKENNTIAYVTVSTGVGGALFTDGRINESIPFLINRVTLMSAHEMCPACVAVSGRDAIDIESMISGTAVEAREKKKPYEVPQDDLLWDTLAGYLSHGLVEMVSVWNPSIIILGGSMMVGNPKILMEDVVTHFSALCNERGLSTTELCLATLDSRGGLYGGLVYLEQKIQKV